MKRLCIYVTYDKEKIVDEYIHYMLKELKTCVDYLVVVCNETEVVSGKHYLENYANEIFYRENMAFDAGAYKDTLTHYLGWKRVLEFDELVLVNDSFYGPFIPMKTIFEEMNQKNVDFWGLTKHKEYRNKYTLAYTQEHIQSFFMVIRKDMLHYDEFLTYWNRMPYYSTFSEVIENFEKQFTKVFFEKGFSYECYADMGVNDTDNIENNFNQYVLISNELIRRRSFPFLKRQQITYDNIDRQTQENYSLALEYIKIETEYDVRLIYKNLIRTMDISDLYKNLCLHYILPATFIATKPYVANVVIAVFIEYPETEEYIIEYLERLKSYYHVIIFCKEKLIAERYCELEYESVLYESEKKVYSFLSSYEYVCVLHDNDMTSNENPSFHGKAICFKKCENLIKSVAHVNNIIEKFEQDEFLGILAAPESNFGDFFWRIGSGWDEKWNDIYRLMKDSNISKRLKKDTPPFVKFEDFWIRGNVLQELSNYIEDCFEFLPYLWGYIAQEFGYYSGIVESDFYASMNTINKQKYLEQICNDVRESIGNFSNYKEFKRLLKAQSLIEYCKSHEKVYVYGAGDYANLYSGFIPNLKAYVVSDGRPKSAELNGKRILYLSEVEMHDGAGFVLCMDKKNQGQIMERLSEKGIVDFFSI